MGTKSRFVREIVLPPAEQLRELLVRRGFLPNSAEWLATALLDTGCVPNNHDAVEALERICHAAFSQWKHFDERDATFLEFVLGIGLLNADTIPPEPLQQTQIAWRPTLASQSKVIQACVTNGVDFTVALAAKMRVDRADGKTPNNIAHSGWSLAKSLCDYGVVDPVRLCNISSLESVAASANWFGDPWSSAESDLERSDPTTPLFWLTIGSSEFLACLLPKLREADDLTACMLAKGVFVTTLKASRLSVMFNSTIVQEVRLAVFQDIDRRVGPDPRLAATPLRHTWMRLALELKYGDLSSLDDLCKERLKLAADYELGQLRRNLKADQEGDCANAFQSDLPIFETSVNILLELTSLWDSLRPVLLVLRNLTKLAVAPDMRYWSDRYHSPDPPRPWNRVPEVLVSCFHIHVKTEQDSDPDLLALRAHLSRFCLDRLKSNKKTGLPIEPDPTWRWAYLQAARELRTNPEGSGHHTLHYAMESDPDVDIREDAQVAYVEMRHGPSLPSGLSPRRTITNAFVWLFQAHYLTVASSDIPIDANGVQRTREEIARRTAEPRPQPSVSPST